MKKKLQAMKIIVKLMLLASIFAGSNSVRATTPGATVPFITFEAEEAILGGGAALDVDETIRRVSSEKSYVHLKATDEFVEFNNLRLANRLTIRYSIPKNADGTISLYLNGVHNQDLQLISAQCYDWDDDAKTRRYNELSVVINLIDGDRVKFQKDADDTCPWYGIDLIDIETAPEPLSMPANYLSITEFGATGDDSSDDTQAIKDCIAAAASQAKGVWIPPGTFLQNTRIALPANLSMMGGGIWHSVIHNTVAGTTYSNDLGYALNGGTTISDIKFTGVGLGRRNAAHLFRPINSNEVLKNLWIQNVACVYGWSPNKGLDSYNVFKDSRVFGTYFDGIHWGDGNSHHNLVENVYFRGLGDDAVAQVCQENRTLCHNNTAKFNTIVASYWGRGMANIGGDTLTYTDNYISSSFHAGLMIATEPLSSNCRPVNGFKFLRNTLHKCGNYGHNHGSIHIWLKVNSMKNVVVKDNIIEYGETEGIHIDNTDFGDADGRIIFENNIARYNFKGAYNNTSDDIYPILINNNGFPGTYTGFHDPLIDPQNSFKIFPNPAKMRLNIESNTGFNSISIYDSVGARVLVQDFNQERTSSSLSLSQLQPGLYALEIRSGYIKHVEKIIKL